LNEEEQSKIRFYATSKATIDVVNNQSTALTRELTFCAAQRRSKHYTGEVQIAYQMEKSIPRLDLFKIPCIYTYIQCCRYISIHVNSIALALNSLMLIISLPLGDCNMTEQHQLILTL